MITGRKVMLWVAGAGAAAAVVVPSAAGVSQLFDAAKPATGSACSAVIKSSLDFARHYTVAARLYAAPGPAKGLPRLATAEEKRRCGNPERLLERIVPAAPARKPAG